VEPARVCPRRHQEHGELGFEPATQPSLETRTIRRVAENPPPAPRHEQGRQAIFHAVERTGIEVEAELLCRASRTPLSVSTTCRWPS
jgi:hypothetical protein